MIRIVWEFRVRAGREQEFERHYSNAGTWAQFFRRDTAFKGTELLRDEEDPLRYLTIDTWTDLESYESFRVGLRREYDETDREMQELMEGERRVGAFDVVE